MRASLGSIIIIGFVRIFFALAAYLRVFIVSLIFERAGEIHAIYENYLNKLQQFIFSKKLTNH